ncbi:MAG: Adenosylcobinamide kinase / Adenosylcobinamide-phosphate guanylyltransferase, partial [uncultured Rubrobacteraceae bacterium]
GGVRAVRRVRRRVRCDFDTGERRGRARSGAGERGGTEVSGPPGPREPAGRRRSRRGALVHRRDYAEAEV